MRASPLSLYRRRMARAHPASRWLIVAGVVACALATDGATADGLRTLRRLHDPVVVRTDRLAELPTRETRNVVLYRVDDGIPVAIPFQFDARDRAGELVVDGPPDFRFDDDDELVFMAADAGDRATTPPCPDRCDAVVEIEVVDPRPGDGRRAWAYLVHFREAPPRTAFEPYVTFDPATQTARSAYYQVEYAKGRNFFTGVRLGAAHRPLGPNLVRQTRMRGSPTFSLLLWDVTLDFTEQNSLVAVDGVRVGPVRAVRRARLSIDLGSLFSELPGGTAYTYHYRTAYLTPSRIGFSWTILKALRDFQFENLLEFVPTTMPLTYFDPAHAGGIALDRLGASEVRTTEDRDWWAHTSGTGTMLHAFVIPSRWLEWGVARGTMLRAVAGGSDDDRGSSSPVYAAGYTLENMTRLREAGTWDLLMASIVLASPFQSGDEEEPMALVRAPLVSETRRVQ